MAAKLLPKVEIEKAATQSWDGVYTGAGQGSSNWFPSSEDWLDLQV